MNHARSVRTPFEAVKLKSRQIEPPSARAAQHAHRVQLHSQTRLDSINAMFSLPGARGSSVVKPSLPSDNTNVITNVINWGFVPNHGGVSPTRGIVMPITRWDPFSEISRLQSDMQRLWGEPSARFSPSVDIFEEESAIVLQAEVPGMKSEDIHVSVDNGVLSLSGERTFESDEKRENYHRIERGYGAFTRSFVLPKTVDPEGIEADLRDGVLSLRLPKKPVAQARRISIAQDQ